jgi:hypothetical protein
MSPQTELANNRMQSDFSKLRLPQPLMRGYMDSPYCQAKPVLTFGIRLQLYIRSTIEYLFTRTKMSIRWKRPHSLDGLNRPLASAGYRFLGLTGLSSTVFADSVGTSLI